MADPLGHLRHVIRPLANRIANSIARAVVQLVDDSTKLQLVQIALGMDQVIDGAESFQAYGFSSVPLPGAEAIVIFPNGDRAHPLVIATGDRGSRPTGGASGDVVMYNAAGAKITLFATGNIEVQPAPGGEVLIRDAAGAVDRLVKKSEHDGHTHPPGTFTTGGGGPVTGVSGGAAAVTGTTKLRAQ